MLRFARAATVLCLALTSSSLFAQGRFEGVITANMNAMQGGTEITYSVKGDQFRMDMAARGMAMYTLHEANGSTLMVMPAQRMYMDIGAMAPQSERKAPDIKPTGKKETVAGYECEHILVTSDSEQWDVCAAKGLGRFTMTNNPMARGGTSVASAWQRIGSDFFPLKVQKVGAEKIFEVTKIEKKSVDNSVFAIPDGFTKMDMGGMRGRPPV